MDESREDQLQDQLHAGSADAWQALYDLHAERLWRAVARLMGRDATEVADVVQETLMAAAKAARQYDATRGPTWPWLWAIARNQLMLHYRKSSRRRDLHQAQARWRLAGNPGHEWIAGRAEPPHSPPSLAEHDELRLLIRHAPPTRSQLSPKPLPRRGLTKNIAAPQPGVNDRRIRPAATQFVPACLCQRSS